MTVPLHQRWTLAALVRAWLKRLRAGADMAAGQIRVSRLGRLPWVRGIVRALASTAIIAATVMTAVAGYICFDRSNLPDPEAFSRFEFPTIGHIYDVNGRPLIEMASEYRQITDGTPYAYGPPRRGQ
jgi:hypothetical protein